MDFSLFPFLFSLKIMHLFDVYPLFDINITKGLGCHVWDDHDTEYLDLYGGHAVISIGHCHPHYVEMLTAQLHKLGFYSNSVINTLQQQFAERLGKACGYDDYQLFLINSGAEANENALKLASFHTGKTRVLSAEKAFHGRTSLAVEATNNPKIIAPINANNHVTFLPLNDLAAWEAELAKGDVAACIIECIQGVGGIRMATEEFAKGLQELAGSTERCSSATRYSVVMAVAESSLPTSGLASDPTSSPAPRALATDSRWEPCLYRQSLSPCMACSAPHSAAITLLVRQLLPCSTLWRRRIS